MTQAAALAGPPKECPLCPRLVDFRLENRKQFPDWHNGVVPPFGDADARLLVVGLAPGLRGANRTARPFTGDYAGQLLYPTLLKYGFAKGTYAEARDDGFTLVDCRVTNAVRCVPPENKPTPLEQKTCRGFLASEIAAMPRLRTILALGRIAHDAVLASLKLRKAAHPFSHGAQHRLADASRAGLTLADSYHCSRYNVNTRVLTVDMFENVVVKVLDTLAN